MIATVASLGVSVQLDEPENCQPPQVKTLIVLKEESLDVIVTGIPAGIGVAKAGAVVVGEE